MSALKLELIFPNKKYVKYMSKITSTSLFQDQGKTIHEEGFYSQDIFGTVGTEERAETFAYIDLGTDILHPRIYDYIISLSSLYQSIMSSKSYAIWDNGSKNFILSDISSGETGYDFFMSHIHEIVFVTTGSVQRQDKIDVLNKYIKAGTYVNDKLLVMPAGLRDFNIEKDGMVKEDDVNDLYKTILNTAGLLSNFSGIEGSDIVKYKLQDKINILYKHILNLLDGKKKMIQGEWASPAVEYRTRTVAIGTEDIINDLDDSDKLIDISKAGLLLYVKSIDPLAKYLLRETFLKHVFKNDQDVATLVNKDTLEPEVINVPTSIMDRWLTNDGMDSIMNMLLDNDVKNEPVTLGDHYLFTIVDTGDKIIKYDDLNMVPSDLKESRRPITYGELFYLSIQSKILKLPGYITRYPATGQESIVPSLVDVFTTIVTRNVKFETVGLIPFETTLASYPVAGESWINGLKVSYTRTDGLGLDFDGDDLNLVMIMGDESIAEFMELLESTAPYIGPDGTSLLSDGDTVSNNVFKFMTRGE